MPAQSFYTLLTQIGAAEIVNAHASGTTLPITHVSIGDGSGAVTIPTEAQTALVNEVHRVPASAISVDAENPNWLVIEAVVPANIGGWTIREIGLVGGDGAGGKLLAVGNFPATYKPMVNEGAAKDLVIRLIVEVSNASVVTLLINPAVVVATVQAINNAVAAHELKPNPHPQYLKVSQRGIVNGVASLDATGLVPIAQLPPAIATDAELAASLAAHVDPALDPHPQYLTETKGDARYALKGGNLSLNAAIISSTGSWTVPPGISKIKAYAIGMGAPGTGGGNGLQNLNTSGGYGGDGGAGGAGGGCAWGDVAVVPGQQIPVTIDAVNTLFGTYLTATAGVGRTNPGAGTVNAGVTNSGTATGGNGGSGAAWGASNQSYPLSGGGGGGGASGSPLGAGKNGATGGVNSHPTYQPFGGGAGGWNTAGNLGNGGNATAIYRGAFNQYSDLLLMPCRSIISGQDGAVLGYGGGGGWMGGGGGGGGSSASVNNSCSGSVGIIGGYGGGGGGGSGASMDGTTSGATKTGCAGGLAGPGCVVIFW